MAPGALREREEFGRWASEDLLELKPEDIGQHYGRYRLHLPEAERAMAKSLERYG